MLIHQNFPGQFRHLAQHLMTLPDVEVLGLGRESAPGLMVDGKPFPWLKYKLHRGNRPENHPYLRQMESAVLHGQAVARALIKLKERGFVPDVILAHPGWGETLYVKEVFPKVRLIHFAEWYYHTEGADFGFDPEFPPTLDDRLRITTWNALHLLNLQNCDLAISPTHWQKSRHPVAYHDKIHVIHEGIDTENLGFDPNATLVPPRVGGRITPSPDKGRAGEGLQADSIPDQASSNANSGHILHAGDPIITYVARNLEPYRGFHIFMRALPQVLAQHPTARVLIVGGDGASYGKAPSDAPNWRIKMLRELGETLAPHLDRIHFLGKVPYDTYRRVLQVSAVHVYLTYPFVLSWSLLEAMASGCHVLASNTAPVREVIEHGRNGWLTDFFDHTALADKILNALHDPVAQRALRAQAQRDVRERYALAEGVEKYLALIGLPDCTTATSDRTAGSGPSP